MTSMPGGVKIIGGYPSSSWRQVAMEEHGFPRACEALQTVDPVRPAADSSAQAPGVAATTGSPAGLVAGTVP